jgi:hypothetical protein
MLDPDPDEMNSNMFFCLDLLFLVAVTSSIFVVSEVKKLGESYLASRRTGKGRPPTRSDSVKSLISLV